jgi:hypothetical protein
MASFELLERLRTSGHREPVEVVEHKAPRELVAARDITRQDALGRTVVAVPAGTVPPHWVKLTKQERQALVEPPRPPPDGWLEPGHCGFTPRNVRVGYGIDPPGRPP